LLEIAKGFGREKNEKNEKNGKNGKNKIREKRLYLGVFQ
jgi:hypothetical protein